jgi:hypothetical protein
MGCYGGGTFDVDLRPGPLELDGAAVRLDFSKTFRGDLESKGAGVMLSYGDPRSGSAGYVAIETVSGRLGDRQGGFALQQFGTMHAGAQTLYYEIVPGSGQAGLENITGTLRLAIDADGPTDTSSSTSFDVRPAKTTLSRSSSNSAGRVTRAVLPGGR